MKISSNTILITGGTSGIGLELASQLISLGNKVIVTGRDQANLDATSKKLKGLRTIQSDVSDPKAITNLYQEVIKEFPDLNMLINNAGIMRKINLHQVGSNLEDITREVEINLNGSIHMVMQFLPHLKKQKNAAIINVSSGLAFVPFPISPIYCASKAGLHSFTQSLRIQLKNSNVKIFELAPPVTDTPLNDRFSDDLKGGNLMNVTKLVNQTIEGIKKDRYEIRPGQSNLLKIMSRVAPQFILKQLSKPVEAMLSQQKG